MALFHKGRCFMKDDKDQANTSMGAPSVRWQTYSGPSPELRHFLERGRKGSAGDSSKPNHRLDVCHRTD
jgi:hypothetical protein